MLEGCGKKGTLLHCWLECKLEYNHYGEQYGDTLEIDLKLYSLSYPLWAQSCVNLTVIYLSQMTKIAILDK